MKNLRFTIYDWRSQTGVVQILFQIVNRQSSIINHQLAARKISSAVSE